MTLLRHMAGVAVRRLSTHNEECEKQTIIHDLYIYFFNGCLRNIIMLDPLSAEFILKILNSYMLM